jgi:hypothetical protein
LFLEMVILKHKHQVRLKFLAFYGYTLTFLQIMSMWWDAVLSSFTHCIL